MMIWQWTLKQESADCLMGMTHVQETCKRKSHRCTWPKSCGLTGRLCLKVYGRPTRNFHRIQRRQLCSIRWKFLRQVSCTSFLSVCQPFCYCQRHTGIHKCSATLPLGIHSGPFSFVPLSQIGGGGFARHRPCKNYWNDRRSGTSLVARLWRSRTALKLYKRTDSRTHHNVPPLWHRPSFRCFVARRRTTQQRDYKAAQATEARHPRVVVVGNYTDTIWLTGMNLSPDTVEYSMGAMSTGMRRCILCRQDTCLQQLRILSVHQFHEQRPQVQQLLTSLAYNIAGLTHWIN